LGFFDAFRRLSKTLQAWSRTCQLVTFCTLTQRAIDGPLTVLMQAVAPSGTVPPLYRHVHVADAEPTLASSTTLDVIKVLRMPPVHARKRRMSIDH
jgi:hypothetical protein